MVAQPYRQWYWSLISHHLTENFPRFREGIARPLPLKWTVIDSKLFFRLVKSRKHSAAYKRVSSDTVKAVLKNSLEGYSIKGMKSNSKKTSATAINRKYKRASPTEIQRPLRGII